MQIRKISKSNDLDLKLLNEPFEIKGKIIVTRVQEKWQYRFQENKETYWMSFPDEDYLIEDIDAKGFALGAYNNGELIGLAIFQNNWNRFLYLSDLKVKKDFRRKGVSKALVKKGFDIACQEKYKGLYTIAQDNNIVACRFYLKQGFAIGGFNNRDYQYTQQEGKADVYFYLDKLD